MLWAHGGQPETYILWITHLEFLEDDKAFVLEQETSIKLCFMFCELQGSVSGKTRICPVAIEAAIYVRKPLTETRKTNFCG